MSASIRDPLHAELSAATRKFAAREVVLRYLPPPSHTRWIATALPECWRVAARMKEFGIAPHGNASLDFYSDQPVARGEGKTVLEAVKALAPEPWREPQA